MSLAFDLFWSFRSPYCHLALDRILDVHAGHDVDVNVRPVHPLAVRRPGFFERAHPNYISYAVLDSRRLAEHQGLPFARPRPDPIVQDPETGALAAEQPYIFRLTRLGQAAARAGRGLAFLDLVSRLLWDGSVDGWDTGTHLADAMTAAGLDAAEMERQAGDEVEALEELIVANQEAHEAAGHWGVPCMVFRGEPFFGQDRLDLLVWRMKAAGLAPRG